MFLVVGVVVDVLFVQLRLPLVSTDGYQYLNGAGAFPVEYATTSPVALIFLLDVKLLVQFNVSLDVVMSRDV